MVTELASMVDELRQAMHRPVSSALHQALAAVYGDRAIHWLDAQVILVGYDVARLFREKVTSSGEGFLLPFDNTVFEFLVDGRPFLAMWSLLEGVNRLALLSRQDSGNWLAIQFNDKSGRWALTVQSAEEEAAVKAAPAAERAAWNAWFQFAYEQIDAICTALEVGLFESVRKRVSPQLNADRARKGKLPLFGFHELRVPLDRRQPTHQRLSGEQNGSIRLHIRRRHSHRFHTRRGLVTKVLPAMWVGNPDLGFVDKHYRLGGPK